MTLQCRSNSFIHEKDILKHVLFLLIFFFRLYIKSDKHCQQDIRSFTQSLYGNDCSMYHIANVLRKVPCLEKKYAIKM